MARVKRFLIIGGELYFLLWVAAILAANRSVDRMAALRGHMQAYVDLSRGHRQLLLGHCGLRLIPDSHYEYQHILRTRYRVDARTSANCELSVRENSYQAAYNATVREEMREQFGPGVFERTQEEARRIAIVRAASAR